MTARQMSIARNTEIADTAAARSREMGFFRAPATDPIIRAMDRIADLGVDDMVDGLRRNPAGMIGGVRILAQVQSYGSGLLISFLVLTRVLVDQDGTYWLDQDGQAVVVTPDDALWVAFDAIWTARAN